MKRMTQISLLFFLFMSYAAQAQSEGQNTVRGWDKVVTEAKRGGYQLITPEKLKKEYLQDSAAFLLVDTKQKLVSLYRYRRGKSTDS